MSFRQSFSSTFPAEALPTSSWTGGKAHGQIRAAGTSLQRALVSAGQHQN